MRASRGWWAGAGLVAGAAGLATSYAASAALARDSAVVAVADGVIRLTPGSVVERAIGTLGHRDKPFLVAAVLVLSAVLFAVAGRLARTRWWAGAAVFGVLAVVGAVALLAERGSSASDVVPVLVGLATWLGCLHLLTEPLRRPQVAPPEGGVAAGSSRRELLVRAGAVVAGAAVVGVVGRVAGGGRRRVEQARRLLRLPGVTQPRPPAGVRVGPTGVTPWTTPEDRFYRVDTTITPPAIDPGDWRLRIHGMVDREVELTYRELVGREVTEAWVTLNCVSNPVGGDLIGNAWWSGVRIADLLAEAGVQAGADAVLQTSHDGWTCGTPLTALTDDRDALLAVAMNGEPLPIDHGFPVRAIVPGLYGYVSACKWVVDLEVTRFADISAFWTDRGWAEKGPVKMSSRIDVPGDGGHIDASAARVGGVAWSQHTGISAVEVAVDGGSWTPAELGRVPSADTWVQWTATLDVEPGFHTLQVRATDADGQVQTGKQQEVLPDGATGWHTIRFEAKG